MKTAIKTLLILTLAFFIIGCDFGNKEKEPQEPETKPDSTWTNPETILVNTKVETFEGFGHEIPVQEINDSTFLFEGDILIEKDHEAARIYEPGEQAGPMKAAVRTKGLWPDNTVYYTIQSTLSTNGKNQVAQAIKWFHDNTNLKFINQFNSTGYVTFQNGSGCSSYIGRTGRKQVVTLGTNGCGFGSTVHEIMHAIGFFHEQSRADRDKHVKILWENIQTGREHNFKTYTESGFRDGADFGNFDFNSIMMYYPTSFTKSWPLQTIQRVDGKSYTANRTAPSAGDIDAINKLYPPKNVAPEYINGKYYTINGLMIYRTSDKWYYLTAAGWKEVELRNGRWYWK